MRRLLTDRHRIPMRRIIILAFALIIIFNVLPEFSFADNGHETVRVGYYENEVFQEGAEDGAVKTGYAYEYYQKLSEYTGWKYEYVYGGFNELYRMLLDGEIDLLAGLARTKEREDIIGYPDEIMGEESYYLVKHDWDADITTDPVSLNGRTIAVLDSAIVNVLNQYLDDHGITAEVIAYPDYTQLFDAFDSRAVDILAAESDGAHGRDQAEVISVFGGSDYYLCVSKDRQDLLAELNAAQRLWAAIEPGYLNTLKTKYYSVSVTTGVFSQAEREWLDNHKSLHVGYFDNYMPFSGTDEHGNVNGAVKEIVPAILDAIGRSDIAVTYSPYENYDDMIAAINAGEVDAVFPVGGNFFYAEQNGIYLSNTISAAPAELIYRGDFTEKSAEHFAINQNNRMQYYFVRTNYPNAEITFYPSTEECLSAVITGKVGCATMNGLRANDILRNRNYNALSHRQTSYIDPRCFGVEIGNEGLLRLLNHGISILGVEYTQNLLHGYNDWLYHYDFADFMRDHMALFGSAIVAIAAIIIFLLARDRSRTKQEIRQKEASRLKLEEKNQELATSKAALSDALIAAEHANNAKTVFLNSMSHDIRTPMNAIVGFTALATSHIDNKEQVEDYLGKISVASQHLLSLINDVLDMSRIESGKMTLEEASFHLPDLIHDLRTIIHSNVAAKQMDLFIDTQDVMHEDIITDKLRLSQVLLNILSNAVKFTPAGGTISFRVIEKPSPTPGYTNFEFRIKDNGIGMSREFQKTIYEAFSRERTTTVSGIQGAGLGMAISKNIVNMMNGTIDLISEEGKGSEFIVNIPCRISDVCVKFEPIPELKGIRALVADDDTNTCLSICSMLREIGMRPDWTNYGKEAVVRAKEALDQADEFRVYIIDWLIPDQNGIETVRKIRRVIGSSAPIIIMTAYDWADIGEEAKEAGVTAFCSKPLFMSELRDVLTQSFTAVQEPPAEQNEPEPQWDFTGKRVLLAEDNSVNQMIAETILTEVNLSVEIANDGTDAVEMVKAAPAGYYDIILMDIQMPKMNGYEATRQIRALEDREKAGIPIAAVTANVFEEDRKAAMDAGMDGFLAKPYDIPEIMETLTRLMK